MKRKLVLLIGAAVTAAVAAKKRKAAQPNLWEQATAGQPDLK
ncbi:MAG TPA: DLW-39 family protein [Mycobacteriales bacterium]|nr:DLW-39 family protein [Mycobacteriales bacterium]